MLEDLETRRRLGAMKQIAQMTRKGRERGRAGDGLTQDNDLLGNHTSGTGYAIKD